MRFLCKGWKDIGGNYGEGNLGGCWWRSASKLLRGDNRLKDILLFDCTWDALLPFGPEFHMR